MIRQTTPLPRRPSAEPELLDAMLEVLRNVPPFTSQQAVTLLRFAGCRAAAVDIRMMLCPPYFKLLDRGWVCTWRLP